MPYDVNDSQVLQIAGAHCPRSYIRQITDGKYLIAGKIVFVRVNMTHWKNFLVYKKLHPYLLRSFTFFWCFS